MKNLFLFFGCMLIPLACIQAQTYEITSIAYTNDPLVAEYYQDKQTMIQWKGLMRDEFERQIKPMVMKLQIKDDTLFMEPLRQKRSKTVALTAVAPGLYEKTKKRSFFRVDLRQENPLLIQGRYIPLEKESDAGEQYLKLREKYGNKVEAFVTSSALSEIDPAELENALNIKKAYLVTDVDLIVNEDVLAFGQRYREHFMGYPQSSEKMIENTYLGSQFKVAIDHKKVKVSSHNAESSSFSFSSSLEQPEEGLYRAKAMKSIWDFYTDPASAENFDLQKLEYITYLPLTEEDKNKPEYAALKEKYGEKLPYNIIVQKVKEVPLE